MAITPEMRYSIQELIDEELDTLVPKVRAIVDNTAIVDQKDKLGKSQLSGLSNVARETDSLEVVIVWVEYQMGRHEAWRYHNFGNEVTKQLRDFQALAKELRPRISRDETDARALTRLIEIGLARQFAGQLERFFTFRAKVPVAQPTPGHGQVRSGGRP